LPDARRMMQRTLRVGLSPKDEQNHIGANYPDDLSRQRDLQNQAQSPPHRLALSWAPHEAVPIPIRTTVRLQRPSPLCPVHRRWERGKRFVLSSCVPLAVIVFLAACSSPAVRQQRLVARPSMTFSDSAARGRPCDELYLHRPTPIHPAGRHLVNDWTTLATISVTNTPTVFRDTNAPASRRFYRTVMP